MNMGPRREIRGTYSKLSQAPLAEDERRKKYKLPNVPFDTLFIPKDENQEQLSARDPFDSLIEVRKPPEVLEESTKALKSNPFRKPLALNSFLTNSTFGSIGHSSANDTFDRFVKVNKLPGCPYQSGAAALSSSSSSIDSTGVLYQSLQSRVHSDLHCSFNDKSKSQVIKDESCKAQWQPRVILEDCVSSVSDASLKKNKNCVNCVQPTVVSPQIFSSDDDEKQNQGTVNLTVVSPQLFSSDADEKQHKKTCLPKPKKRKSKVRKVKKSSKSCTRLKYDEVSENSNTDDLRINELITGNNSHKKSFPERNSKRPHPANASPEGNRVLLSISSPKNFNEVSRTPCNSNFTKAFFHHRLLSSQRALTVCSQFSGGSQDSGKSSSKSALTSTPADISRINSLTHSFEPSISPVSGLLHRSSLNTLNSPSNFQSPLSVNLKSSHSIQNSDNCGSSTCAKVAAGSSSKGQVGNDGSRDKSSKVMDVGEPQNFYNSSMELKSGPFEGVSIPVFDPGEGLRRESPDGPMSRKSFEGFVSTKPPKIQTRSEFQPESEQSIILRNFTKLNQKSVAHKVSQMVGGHMLSEVSQHFSSEKLKQINSFLNRPSFSIPLKTRQQQRFSKNKVKPLPLVKRLTRRTAVNTDNLSLLSHKENIDTDQSTTTEPSFVVPRRKERKLTTVSTTKQLLYMRAEANSSTDSVLSNGPASSYFSKPSPVLPKRTSVRLAVKRETYPSFKFWEKPCVSTRSHARKAHKLSIMQFSLSSVKSVNTDLDDSKVSVASKICVSDNESVNSVSERERAFGQNKETSNVGDSSLESSVPQSYVVDNQLMENQVIMEEVEEPSVSYDYDSLPARKDDSQVGHYQGPSVKTTCVNLGHESGKSDLDVSLDELFELPFQVPAKRGKGWIRSLSLARASLLGLEQIREPVRRQTVHHMSVGGNRRMTHMQLSMYPEITVEESYHQVEDPLSRSVLCDPRRHVLTLCSQVEPLPITECFTESRLSCCRKIGEGVYGEVFMTKPNPTSMDGAAVLKIMPIEGDFDVNGEMQKKFHEILSEIIISLELSNLSSKEIRNMSENFVHVLNCWCVEGSYHQDMLQLWDLYHEEKGSENDRPDMFPESQLYIVLEFTHGGRDLEGFMFNNAGQSLAVFLQIAYSLAVAEQELEFEHRDLHWGNVLVATTKDSSIDFKVNDGIYTLQTQGVKATVIDFTLSRLNAPHCIMFNNLAEDPSLFTAEGDYQFEIYRQMKKANRNDWQKFTPYTNVLWLHYVLDKMIKECYYKNIKTKIHKTNLDKLHLLKKTMLQSESATAFVLRREHGIID